MNTKTKNLLLTILVVILASSVPAIIFGKWLGAFVFLVCHTMIRPQFDLQYHHIRPIICRTITGCVAFFGILFLLPYNISLISAIPINYIVGWVGCIRAKNDLLERKLQEIYSKTIWEMETRELIFYLKKKGIKDERAEFVVLVLQGWTFSQIAEKLNYAESTLWDWSKILKKKLNIKSWKHDT